MRWYKARINHTLYGGMNPKEFMGFHGLLALTAHIEKFPTTQQMLSVCTQNVLDSISKRLENEQETLSKVLEKVLEDVDKVHTERTRKKAYMQGKRENVPRNFQGTTEGCSDVDKIRLDKIRLDKSTTTTSSGYTFYVNNINLMPSPYESEKVIDIIGQYTDEWFINACKVAIQNNARKLNYIEAVLKKSKEKGTGVTESKKQSYAERVAHAEKMEKEAGL